MKSTSKKRTQSIVNLTVKRRYLTEREVERLMECARKHGRYGHRDATMILVAYRHGLRASEVCDLQWQQIELSEGRLHVHRVKNGIPSVHPIRGDEMRALRKLRRDYPREAYVFVSESGGPISPIGFHRLIQRLGEAAKMPVPIHPHMLRHACGFKLANDGHDTRASQYYLGHKNIQHTVRYTDMAPDRFKDSWRGRTRATTSRCLRGPCRRRQARDDFRLALNHLRRVVRPDIKHRPDRSDGLLDLLIAHLLDRAGMLDLHFPRHQERANLHVGRRLRLAHLFNRCRPVLFEVGSEREQEILVERSTCSLQGPEFSIFSRPPPRGLSLTPGREAFHPMDAAGPDHLFAYAAPATLATKGRAMRCTVLGFTSNLAAVLRTLMPPARAALIRSASLSAIGGRPRRLPSRLARCRPARTRS